MDRNCLLPGLPRDLAMLCLAKLPLDAVARSRAVSRSWEVALRRYPSVGRLPQALAAFCRGKENDNSMTWLFLSRSDLRSLVVPFFFTKGTEHGVTCIYTSRLQLIATGTKLLLVRVEVHFRDAQERGSDSCQVVRGPNFLQGFDLWQMKWVKAAETPWSSMPVDRWLFATAHIGRHVYFAGGEGPNAAISAERLSLDTWTWESLPPMHRKRSFIPSAFTMDGRFFVVGGESDMVSGTLPQSGEYYDPSTNAWTLVLDMWPHELWWGFGGPQIVAVIKNMAYTIDNELHTVVRMEIHNPPPASFEWKMVGHLPQPEFYDEPRIATMHSLLSVQDELWVVYNTRDHDSLVFACKPHLCSEGLDWECLPFSINPSTRSTMNAGLAITI